MHLGEGGRRRRGKGDRRRRPNHEREKGETHLIAGADISAAVAIAHVHWQRVMHTGSLLIAHHAQ